jgi:hypothetical protein
MASEELSLLLAWVQAVVSAQLPALPAARRWEGLAVENFTTSLADGRALCLLLHYYHPSVLPLDQAYLLIDDARARTRGDQEQQQEQDVAGGGSSGVEETRGGGSGGWRADLSFAALTEDRAAQERRARVRANFALVNSAAKQVQHGTALRTAPSLSAVQRTVQGLRRLCVPHAFFFFFFCQLRTAAGRHPVAPRRLRRAARKQRARPLGACRRDRRRGTSECPRRKGTCSMDKFNSIPCTAPPVPRS